MALFAGPVTTVHNREGTEPKINSADSPNTRWMEKELQNKKVRVCWGGSESFTHSFVKYNSKIINLNYYF